REVLSELGMQELVYAFGKAEVPQPVEAEILELSAVGECRSNERRCGRREQDLLAVGHRPDPGAPVDVRAAVVGSLVASARFSGVDRHANLDVHTFGPGLAMDRELDGSRRGNRVGGLIEYREE